MTKQPAFAPGIRCRAIAAALATGVWLSACGGGGGGDAQAVDDPGTATLTVTGVLEGDAGLQGVRVSVVLGQALQAPVSLDYSTGPIAGWLPAGNGFATGGATCAGSADYVAVDPASPRTVSLPAGVQATTLLLPLVCGDTRFEATESFVLHWRVGSQSGTLVVRIVNDDAGGLNGAGVATVLGGGPAFGRDTDPLTNAAPDGAAGFSFADTATGACRSDRVTGLTWSPPDGLLRTLPAAAAEAGSASLASLCGFTDWRLPGVEELASLVDHRLAAPAALNADALAAPATAMTGTHWSSEPRAGSLTLQMVVDFSDRGQAGVLLQSASAQTRLVRGAPLADPCDAASFTVHGDGTVSDRRTGLMWKQCPEGLEGAACGAGAALDSSSADPVQRLALVNGDATGRGLGYGDWRIPSRPELASLLCRSALAAPLIQASVFPVTDPMAFLTATPDPFGLFWFVDFSLAGTVGTDAGGGKRLRLVRAGQ